jgi:hypothetical protein
VLSGFAGTMQETVGWFPASDPPVGNKEEDKSYQPFLETIFFFIIIETICLYRHLHIK